MKAMLLAVAYSANIGGIGTLIGTPVNLILIDQLKTTFNRDDAGEEINFLTWMYFALPVSMISLVLCWIWLLTVYVGVGKVWRDIRTRETSIEDEKVAREIRNRYAKLGEMSYTEYVVMFHFVSLAILWLTRNPKFIEGWQAKFAPGHVKDSTVALLVCFSLFVFPSKPNFIRWCMGKEVKEGEFDQNNMPKPAPTILQWKEVQHKLAWDVIILLGAGFALADACTSSGLSTILGESIAQLMDCINPALLPFIISLLISFITGFTSNTSTASVFLPILMMVCVEMSINPLILCIPVTMACSFAFM
jgi:sodium-dependent dicarboxylate transporter 2/3/5